MKKLATLSNAILATIGGLFLLLVYIMAIQPTVKLYGELKELRSLENNSISESPSKGNLKELKKLDELLSELKPKQNLQATVLSAIGKRNVRLQSFKEEKIAEGEFGGEKNVSKHALRVSGSYKELLALAGDLKELAISSSSIYSNEKQQRILDLKILALNNEEKHFQETSK